MSIKAASLFVEVGADVKGAEKGISGVEKRVSGLQKAGTKSLKVLGGAITAAGAGFVALGVDAMGAYSEFERMGASLQQLVAKEKLNAGAAANMQEALAMSAGEAKNLQGWVQKLAIQSPFSAQGVADAYRMAMAYGFNTEQSKRLTRAMIDFSAGSGASEETMSRIALALGQIQARGKLAGQEVLQLTEAGLGVDQILADAFGKTTGEIQRLRENGLIPADQAIDAIVTSLERDFGGAAQRQSGTMAGLVNSLQDLKKLGETELFGPIFREFQPDLENFVNTLQDPKTAESLRNIGAELANMARSAVDAFGWLSSGTERVAGGFGQVLDDVAGQGGGATEMIATFGEKYKSVIEKLNGSGISGMFVDRAELTKNMLGELSGRLVETSGSYGSYSKAMTDALQSAGLLSTFQYRQLKASGDLMVGNEYLARTFGVLTREQYNTTLATQTQSEAAQSAAWHQHELTMAGQFLADSNKQSAASFLQVGQAAQMSADDIIGLGQAQQDFSTAVMSFNQNYAGQLVQKLEAAGIKGENYTKALGVIDENLGTNTLATHNASQAMDEMIKNYKDTGKIEAFDKALGNNRDQWAKIDESIQNALTSWRDLITSIGSVDGKHIALFVDIVSSYGSTGWASAPSSNRSDKKHGGEADDGDNPGFALGGQADAGRIYRWQEQGQELFIPESDGYVMNGASTAKLLALLEKLAGGGVPTRGGGDTYVIYEASNARQTALEIARIQRGR